MATDITPEVLRVAANASTANEVEKLRAAVVAARNVQRNASGSDVAMRDQVEKSPFDPANLKEK